MPARSASTTELRPAIHSASPVFGRLRERCDIVVYTTPHRSIDEVVERIGDAEIIVANRERTPLHAETLERVPNLRLIAQTGMRGAHLDVAAATERGILIAGTGGSKTAPSSGYAAASTVEMTVGLMLVGSVLFIVWQRRSRRLELVDEARKPESLKA